MNTPDKDVKDKEEACCCTQEDGRMTPRGEKLKGTLLTRLNRIEGQIRGVKGMVERDAYCDSILNQVAAAQAALSAVSRLLLENHIRGCVAHKIHDGDDEIIDELITTIGRMLR